MFTCARWTTAGHPATGSSGALGRHNRVGSGQIPNLIVEETHPRLENSILKEPTKEPSTFLSDGKKDGYCPPLRFAQIHPSCANKSELFAGFGARGCPPLSWQRLCFWRTQGHCVRNLRCNVMRMPACHPSLVPRALRYWLAI